MIRLEAELQLQPNRGTLWPLADLCQTHTHIITTKKTIILRCAALVIHSVSQFIQPNQTAHNRVSWAHIAVMVNGDGPTKWRGRETRYYYIFVFHGQVQCSSTRHGQGIYISSYRWCIHCLALAKLGSLCLNAIVHARREYDHYDPK